MSIAQERRIEELEKMLSEAQTRQSIAWVGGRLGEALATQLAFTPYEQWREREKLTLHAVCGNATTALELYIQQLPKD